MLGRQAQLIEQGQHFGRGRQGCHRMQGVDHRVAGDNDALGRARLRAAGSGGTIRWGKMQIGDHAGHPAVDLFGERLPFIVGAQTGLHMPDPDAVVISQQGGRHDRGGIALHQHPIGLQAGENRVQVGEHGGGQVGQGLVGAHQVQIDIRD